MGTEASFLLWAFCRPEGAGTLQDLRGSGEIVQYCEYEVNIT